MPALILACMPLHAQEGFPAEKMPVGAYYYPEHWDPGQWERDLKRISELGFRFSHFAEFAWSMLEPEEGVFDFTWLDRNVELAQKHGLKVILCTPTPTPPAWLTSKHPEVLIVQENRIRLRHGTRLHISGTHPLYLEYVERIVRKMAQRYGDHPAVWGWQIDNEPHYRGLYDYSENAQERFREWLRKKYGGIDALNEAWGNSFWSMTYKHFGQIRIPNRLETGPVNPHALLDFKRFQSRETAHFLRFQARVLRDHVSPDQFVTTNYAYFKFLPPVDPFLNRGDLDFASHTMYLLSTALDYDTGPLAFRLGSGMELSFSAELARSVNGYTGIMELQPGQINWGSYNAQPLPGAVRMWIWHVFGLGDRFTCTYRFRQPLFGGEMYHHGIMQTDGVTLSPGGEEYVRAIGEIAALESRMEKGAEEPDDLRSRRVAFLWSQDNLFDLENMPHTRSWDPWAHYYTYYAVLKSMGCPVDFLVESDVLDPQRHPFLVAPSYQLLDSALVDRLEAYARKGGRLILSCRSGQKDRNGHLWEAKLQEPVWDLIGAGVAFNDQLPPGRSGTIDMEGNTHRWSIWAEILDPYPGTDPWASYSDMFYRGRAAVTHRKTGEGSVTYIGAWSVDGSLEKAALRSLFMEAGAAILDLRPYVFMEWRNGYWVAVNYSSETVSLPTGDGTEFYLGEGQLEPGGVTVWCSEQ